MNEETGPHHLVQAGFLAIRLVTRSSVLHQWFFHYLIQMSHFLQKVVQSALSIRL